MILSRGFFRWVRLLYDGHIVSLWGSVFVCLYATLKFQTTIFIIWESGSSTNGVKNRAESPLLSIEVLNSFIVYNSNKMHILANR
jgi:hypothetical protein